MIENNNTIDPAAANGKSIKFFHIIQLFKLFEKSIDFFYPFFGNFDEYKGTSSKPNYVVPVKRVTMGDMAAWEKSQAYYDIIGFINAISQSIQGKKLSVKLEPSPIADNLVAVFDKLNKLVDETPPLDQPQRFGNKAYRDWFAKMQESSMDLLKSALPNEFHAALIEIQAYFVESFGNATRIDYGTGHELAFVMFLCALYKVHALTEHDNVHTGLKIFNAYLLFVRRLQLTYRMEPAGSHGVSNEYLSTHAFCVPSLCMQAHSA